MPSKHKSNNPSGRPAGSPNRTTREMRELLKKIIDAEMDVVQENLAKLNPDKRIDFLVKILPYCLPKINPVDPEQQPDNANNSQNTIRKITEHMIESARKIKLAASEHSIEQPQ